MQSVFWRCLLACAITLACAFGSEAALPKHGYANTYVVQLFRYLPFARAQRQVRDELVPSHMEGSTWSFVSRSNVATSLPTDFVVIRASSQEIVDILRASPRVHRVTAQGMHARALNGFIVPENADEAVTSIGSHQLAAFGAEKLWDMGAYGQGVKVAVFDTGISLKSPWFPNVVERTDWTEEGTVDDHIGHGTFIAGLIGGSHPRCPGLAPKVEILSFRVFSGTQVSYTSWFLDAFNYALQSGVHVLNLSIGGPDAADEPFTDKIRELAAAGIIVVSAVGNDGPLWGSLNSPGDLLEVVGVGGAEPTGEVASFSSRGMTTHELESPHTSYGRVKPDIVAYGRALSGPSHTSVDGYRRLSGTSVASPVVAGAIALIASLVPASRRAEVVNPASVKRALLSSARKLPRSSMYEQGAGLLDIVGAAEQMKYIDQEYLAVHNFRNRSRENRKQDSGFTGEYKVIPGMNVYLFPAYLDLAESECGFMWPHCAQALVPGSLPVTVNVSLMNPGGIRAEVESVDYEPCTDGEKMMVEVSVPHTFGPWTGSVGVHISAVDAINVTTASSVAEGYLHVRVRSVLQRTYAIARLPIRARIVPRPGREKRLLWDVFHSLKYPPGYVPRDSLSEPVEVLDWLGDHPHTNFEKLTRYLQKAGYFIDVLDRPLACLSTSVLQGYGAVLFVDSEDYFSTEEIRFLENQVRYHGLGLVVIADWYNTDVMNRCRFEDDNTRSWWVPISAGANVPALNDLLEPFGIAFGNVVFSGSIVVNGASVRFESGNSIVDFPKGGEVVFATKLILNPANSLRNSSPNFSRAAFTSPLENIPVLGITNVGAGRVAVYGDSNCVDTAYKGDSCHDMLLKLVEAVSVGGLREKVFLESVILSSGLPNTAGEVVKKAEPLMESYFRLFQPHSRTLASTWGASQNLGFRDTPTICWEKQRRMTRVRADIGRSEAQCGARIPIRRLAEPVGSTSKYYTQIRACGTRSFLLAVIDSVLGAVGLSLCAPAHETRVNWSTDGTLSRSIRRSTYGGAFAVGAFIAVALLLAFREMRKSPRLRQRLCGRYCSRPGGLSSAYQFMELSSSSSSCTDPPLTSSVSLKRIRRAL